LTATATKLNNLQGQTLLFCCLETGFVTTAPALNRNQQGRGICSSRNELAGECPSNLIKTVPSSNCEHCWMEFKGNLWAFRHYQQTKKCLASRVEEA
jgi:hypothetical protein